MALESVAVGALGSALDYVIVWTLVGVMGVRAPIGTAIGLSAGASLNFVLNRKVFLGKTPTTNIWPQLARYVQVIGVLMVIHTVLIWQLREHAQLPLVPVKLAADFLLFGCTQPFLLRFYVFKPATPLTVEQSAPHELLQRDAPQK